MNINATLILQAIVFLILVWFTMKFIWPPITKALDERAQKIADGLAAADKAKTELAAANKRVEAELATSRNETASRLADAERAEHPARHIHPAGTCENDLSLPVGGPLCHFVRHPARQAGEQHDEHNAERDTNDADQRTKRADFQVGYYEFKHLCILA